MERSHAKSPSRALVDAALRGAYQRGWQGSAFAGSLRGISPAQALWRPATGRRCIWEHVLHAAYWKHSIARILHGTSGAKEVGPFPLSPSNWPRVPEKPDSDRWKRDRAILASMHDLLLLAADSVPDHKLPDRPAPKYKWTIAQYIAGIAAHDAYHCGQVQLLKRLMRERPTGRT